MAINIKEHITYTIEGLTEEHLNWLNSEMQNPLHPDETPSEYSIRNDWFHATHLPNFGRTFNSQKEKEDAGDDDFPF